MLTPVNRPVEIAQDAGFSHHPGNALHPNDYMFFIL
jgi:hypothetical protein